MKFEIDKKKSVEAVTDIVKGTVELGKKAVINTKNNVTAIFDKARHDSNMRKLKKYNPVFPEQYGSAEFNIPNLIMIVDDAVRRGIDVCEGSIGWLTNETGVEVLCLYDEAVEFSGIKFVPTAACDALYYVDSFDRNRFIRTDYIFSKAQEERLAELKHIAYSLGAKFCSIEINESVIDKQTKESSVDVNLKAKEASASEKAEHSYSRSGRNNQSGRIEITFDGCDKPTRPELKWFSHDDNIIRLIEMRCNGTNAVRSETLELLGSTSATMSKKAAYAIDVTAGKMGGESTKVSMDSQVEKEHRSKLLFHIEF